MSDDRAVVNVIARFFTAVDERDWDRVTSLMTTPVHIDYSSFGAGDPADVNPTDVVAGWRGILPGFDHTHHQLGNLLVEVDGDRASAQAYVTATHVIDAEVWTVVGRYQLELTRAQTAWRLSSLRLLFKYQAGATALPEEATRRAQAR